MSSLTLYTVTGFGEASGNYTLSPPANATTQASTTLYCYYTVASSGVTWSCPSGVSVYNTIYVINQAGASALYLAVSETLPGSPASYGYLNSTNPFPGGNVTSFPTSGSYSAYYIAGSTSATAIPIVKGLTVWQTALPCTLGSALTSVTLSENKPSPSSQSVSVQPTINGTALRTWLTGNLTLYTCAPSWRPGNIRRNTHAGRKHHYAEHHYGAIQRRKPILPITTMHNNQQPVWWRHRHVWATQLHSHSKRSNFSRSLVLPTTRRTRSTTLVPKQPVPQ